MPASASTRSKRRPAGPTGSASTYVLKSYSATSYKGKTVKVRFVATTDVSATTSFRIDDVSLKSDG